LDLYKTIQMLHEERERLDKLIAYLEHLKASKTQLPSRKPSRRRGRRPMSASERQEISARMRKYWASRRSLPAAATEAGPIDPSAASANAANA